ncbi:MAG: radical SAM protein [Candidatus Riflebacteria bacterium]
MHLLFVVPRYARPGQFYGFPAGLAGVYSYAKSQGISVSCVNLCHTESSTYEVLKNRFEKTHVDMVCTGGMCVHWDLISDILSNAKKINPKVITVVGGAIITAEPEIALSNLDIDYGVIGEGEYVLVELVRALENALSVDKIKSIGYKLPDGRINLTDRRPEIEDLDALPFPEYEDFEFDQSMGNLKFDQLNTLFNSFDELRDAVILGSRSCPFSCTFCYHPLGKKYRVRSLDSIFNEIDFLIENYQVNVVSFLDELFSLDKDRMLEFARRIKPYKLKWSAQFRAKEVEESLVKELVDSGLMTLYIGIESMSETILESMKKNTKKEDIVSALEVCRKLKLYCSGNIILGDPAETTDTVKESIGWWQKHPEYSIQLAFILAVPDSQVYRYALKNDLIPDRVKHLKNMPLVNISKLTDQEYFNLYFFVELWNLLFKNLKLGKVHSTRKLPETHNGKNFYKVELECPFCHGRQEHKRFWILPVPYSRIICTHCFAPFKFKQRQAFPSEVPIYRMAWHLIVQSVTAYLKRYPTFRENFELIKKKFRWIKYGFRK